MSDDHLRRGRLIVVDGIDGGGKSTQMDVVERWLRDRGRSVKRLRDPGSTAIGDSLRELLLQSRMEFCRRTEALIFMAARSELVASRIEPAIAGGCDVLCDRYLLSTVVYQSVGGDLEPRELWDTGRWACGHCDPDLTILLDLPAAVALERIGPGRDRMEARGVEYLETVRQAYLTQVSHGPGEHRVVDATADVATVSAEVLAILGDVLSNNRGVKAENEVSDRSADWR